MTFSHIHSVGVSSILASLYRVILRDLGVTHEKFNYLMLRYLNDRRNNIPQNIKDRADTRGNLNKKLLKDTMTWDVFCTGLNFLNVTKFDFNLVLEQENKKESLHQLKDINPKQKMSDVLALFFQQILSELTISDEEFSRLLNEYKETLPSEAEKQKHLGLKKTLTQPRISWKFFCKGLLVLKITTMSLTVFLHHPVGGITVHKLTVVIRA